MEWPWSLRRRLVRKICTELDEETTNAERRDSVAGYLNIVLSWNEGLIMPSTAAARNGVEWSSQSRKSLADAAKTASSTPIILFQSPRLTFNMLSSTSRGLSRTFCSRLSLSSTPLARYGTQTDNPVPANLGPNTPQRNAPLSATKELPTSSEGSHDRALQESVEKGEELRTTQAPNRKGIWSRSQQPREKAMVGPRFEQMIMADQVGLRLIALK